MYRYHPVSRRAVFLESSHTDKLTKQRLQPRKNVSQMSTSRRHVAPANPQHRTVRLVKPTLEGACQQCGNAGVRGSAEKALALRPYTPIKSF